MSATSFIGKNGAATPPSPNPLNNDLIEAYERAIALLSAEQIYNRYPHQFKDDHSGKLRGYPPFRESKSGTSFTVFGDKGFCDAGDGFSGSPADYIHSLKMGRWERAKGRDFVEAVKELCQLAGVTFPERSLSPEQIEKAQLGERRREMIGCAIAFCSQILWTDVGLEARRYLNEERGLSDNDIRNLGLGYYANHKEVRGVLSQRGFSPDEIKAAGLGSPKWNGYITYPWLDEQSRPLTIYGRYHQKQPPEGQPKTLALPGQGTKRSPLYLDRVLSHNHRNAIFVEGVNDAALLQARGETRVLSGVAASFSNEQIETLKRRGIETIYHLGDPDGGGIAGTNSNLQRLTLAGISVFVPPRLPDGLDPDEYVIEYGLEAFHKLIEASQHGFRWKAKQIIATYTLEGEREDEQRQHILREAIAWSQTIPKTLQLKLELETFFWKQLCEQLGIKKEEIPEKLQEVNNEPMPISGNVPLPKWAVSELGQFIANRHRYSLAWHKKREEWYAYGTKQKGVWSIETKYTIEKMIIDELTLIDQAIAQEKRKEPRGFSYNLVTGIRNILKSLLGVEDWDGTDGMLPLLNGVLNLSTKEFKPHSPQYRLTYCLPYEYNPVAICDPIIAWMEQMTQGDMMLREFFRAHLGAIIRGRTDIQSYLELLGPGGTGKGTLTRLATALIGDKNVVSTTLNNLETNRFDTARLHGAKLVVITDADKFGGEVSVLKALTGEDKLRFEQKYKQPLDGFYAKCRVIICANEAPQSSDYTSGLGRRRQTTYLTNKIPLNKQRNLISFTDKGVVGEFAPYLPGLLNWVLAMPETEMERVIRETPITHSAFAKHKAQSLCETNPIADWLDQAVVFRDGYRANVGVAKRDKDSSSPTWFQATSQWLYANYAEFCLNTGAKAVSVRRFVNLLGDLVVNQLGLLVKRSRDRLGSFFEGLKLRSEIDDDPLLISGDISVTSHQSLLISHQSDAALSHQLSSNNPNCDGTVTDSVTAETLTRDGCDGSDGLLENLVNSYDLKNSQIEIGEKENFVNLPIMPSHDGGQTHTQSDCDGNFEYPSQIENAVTSITNDEGVQWDEIIAQIDQQMERLGWDKQRGQRHLIETYGVKSRVKLTDKQVFEFLDYLQGQPRFQVGQMAMFQGMRVVIQQIVNEVVAVVRALENPKDLGFEVALCHLKA